MKKMIEKVMGTLRSAFQAEPEQRQVSCWVPECTRSPALVLAGTEDGVLAGCREHAREWVTSDACRIAADPGGLGLITALERWGEANGPSPVFVSMRPRNDVLILRHAADH
jgi:hypothetical protein